MSRLFEVFGYPLDDHSEEAQRSRKSAWCPFNDCECDGGGNRYLSHIDLTKQTALKVLFPSRKFVPSGVCSLQLRPEKRPWIVCPRRLLALGNATPRKNYQSFTESFLLKYAGYSVGETIGVWSEVKVKYGNNQSGKVFDYTFDYILMPLGRIRHDEIERATGKRWKNLHPVIKKAGYSLSYQGDDYYVEDFPKGFPCIVEIMTSSTAGGNKKNRTTIPMAFEDAMLGKPHKAPGINYRQVWARMVSQFIVKSEISIAWGGKTFWVLQDTLADYISATTALDFDNFLAEQTSEVNVLSFSYGDAYKNPDGVVEINKGTLYAGLISSNQKAKPSFQDIIRTPVCPPKSMLIELLARRSPTTKMTVTNPVQ
jgi:hypothetical protein